MAEDQRTRARTRNSQTKGRVDHPSAAERPEAPRRSGGCRAAPRTPDAQGVCPAPRNLGHEVAAGERADLGGNSPREAVRCGSRRVRRGPMLTRKIQSITANGVLRFPVPTWRLFRLWRIQRADARARARLRVVRCGNRRVRRGPMLTWKSHRSPLRAHFSSQATMATFLLWIIQRADARARARCALRQ